MKSDALLKQLFALHPQVIDLSLARMWRVLAALNNPQDKLPAVIHIAGTNGKGSTLAYLRSLYEQAGLRVHVYTSPHLCRFHERIRIAGRLIDDDQLCTALQAVIDANAGQSLTFFEATTAAALWVFAREPADLVLLETGLGGRLDATNVVAQPQLTLLSPIAMDHCEYLGTTLAAIAGEKAGIIKAGCKVLSAAQSDEAWDVIRARAAQLGAPLRRLDRDYAPEYQPQGFRLNGQDYHTQHMIGAHQSQNAALALAALDWLQERLPIPPHLFQQALDQTQWPARLQRLSGRAQQLLPNGAWLDGGHNAHAAQALAQWCEQTMSQSGSAQKFTLVFAMLKTKDAARFLTSLAPYTEQLITLEINDEPLSYGASELAEIAQKAGMAQVSTAPNLGALFDEGSGRLVGCANPVLLCGSLYFAGQVLSYFALEPV